MPFLIAFSHKTLVP